MNGASGTLLNTAHTRRGNASSEEVRHAFTGTGPVTQRADPTVPTHCLNLALRRLAATIPAKQLATRGALDC